MTFDLLRMFRYDHRSWLVGYRYAREGQYRYCPTLDFTDRFLEMLRDVDQPSYSAGFYEGMRMGKWTSTTVE